MMLNNKEASQAILTANEVIERILFDHNGSPRSKEQVRLMALVINVTVDSCSNMINPLDVVTIKYHSPIK